ncbi:MAG: PASTA domain-containing protein [Clostridia bacterium]|nr:PASTA domain-containing protein [Clostridia bacterium]
MGLSPSAATALLERIGVEATALGEGALVSAQSPAAGTQILKKGGRIVLTLGSNAPEQTLAVPNVVGLSAAAANRLLQDSGFNITVCGAKDYYKVDKTVIDQLPAAGTPLPSGGSVCIYFSYDAIKE